MANTESTTEKKSAYTNSCKIELSGNLVDDMQVSENNPEFAEFRVACNDTPDHTSFFNITLHGQNRINTLLPYLKKGTYVKVEGTERQDRWNDKETGEPRSTCKKYANEITFYVKKENTPES